MKPLLQFSLAPGGRLALANPDCEPGISVFKKYHRKISKAVSTIRAAQFLQVENQMARFVDMSIASEMPASGPAHAEAK